MDSSNKFCAPLQQLTKEHQELRKVMDQFYEITEEIEYESGPDVVQLFTDLYEKVSVFNDKLKEHSGREEEWLFPMMTRHLGENDRTIENMEFEHEKAEQHLEDFLTEGAATIKGQEIDEHDVQFITVYAVQAYATLTQHFANEEKALFPLAEKLLSDAEKLELEVKFKGGLNE